MSVESELAAYRGRRAALISDDRSYRRDIRTQLSEAEVKAEKVVREIRALEASTIWKQEHPSIPHPFPGMEFLTGTILSLRSRTLCLMALLSRTKHHCENKAV